MSPVEGYKQFLPQVVPMQMPVANVQHAVITQQQQYQQPMQAQPVMPPMMVQAPMMVQPQAVASIPQQQQYIPPEMIAQQQQTMMMHTQPMMMVQPQPMVPQPQAMIPQQQMIPQAAPVPIVATVDQFNSAPLLESLVQIQPTVVPTGPLPAAPTPTPPQSGQASRSMSFSEKAPAVPDSP